MGQTGVTKSLKKDIYYGTPQVPYRQKLRETIYLKNILNVPKK
jgi:UDP-3-O-[3-hydroxymyristoyl] glucosamine N-acyltransferase